MVVMVRGGKTKEGYPILSVPSYVTTPAFVLPIATYIKLKLKITTKCYSMFPVSLDQVATQAFKL